MVDPGSLHWNSATSIIQHMKSMLNKLYFNAIAAASISSNEVNGTASSKLVQTSVFHHMLWTSIDALSQHTSEHVDSKATNTAKLPVCSLVNNSCRHVVNVIP